MTTNPKLPVTRGTGGRPAYTDDVRKKILLYLRQGNVRETAAKSAGVGVSTFYRWMAEDETFREAVEQAESDAERLYVGMLRTQARAGDTAAVKFWLERRRHTSWRERSTIEVVDSIEKEVSGTLTDDDLASRLADLAREAQQRAASSADGASDPSTSDAEGPGEPR